MSNVNCCTHCNKPLVNRRRDARTCNSVCRNHAWRTAQARPVSLKLVLSMSEYKQLKSDADELGILVNQLAISRVAVNTHGGVYQ